MLTIITLHSHKNPSSMELFLLISFKLKNAYMHHNHVYSVHVFMILKKKMMSFSQTAAAH